MILKETVDVSVTNDFWYLWEYEELVCTTVYFHTDFLNLLMALTSSLHKKNCINMYV